MTRPIIITSYKPTDAHEDTKGGRGLHYHPADDGEEASTTMTMPILVKEEIRDPDAYLMMAMEPKRTPMQAPTELPIRAPILNRSKHSPILRRPMIPLKFGFYKSIRSDSLNLMHPEVSGANVKAQRGEQRGLNMGTLW